METEGKAQIEGTKRPRIEGKARIKGAARDKNEGRGMGGGSSVSPSLENFCKIDSEMVQSGAYFTSKLSDQANRLICPCLSTQIYISIYLQLFC